MRKSATIEDFCRVLQGFGATRVTIKSPVQNTVEGIIPSEKKNWKIIVSRAGNPQAMTDGKNKSLLDAVAEMFGVEIEEETSESELLV